MSNSGRKLINEQDDKLKNDVNMMKHLSKYQTKRIPFRVQFRKLLLFLIESSLNICDELFFKKLAQCI